MSLASNYLLPFLFIPIFIMSMVSAYENTEITVSLIGNSVINLDDFDNLIRAYVDVINFDPRDGSYFMHIIQSSTGNTISEQEILIRETGNDKAGANVAYLLNEDVLNTNGTSVQGDYEILIKTESGNSVARTTFSIIKPSEADSSLSVEDEPAESSSEKQEGDEYISSIQLKETVTLEPFTQTESEDSVALQTDSEINEQLLIPEWIRNIFILYAEGSISESELLNAIKFLISQEIIIV